MNIDSFSAENEVLLLQPVSFTLLLKRNLSTSWFKSVPDIDMSGRLNKINLLLSHEDYLMIMNVLSENLGETFEEPQKNQMVVRHDRKSQQVDEYQKSKICK